jgi:RNA polymerase sigma-70 factor, ECF subfamily
MGPQSQRGFHEIAEAAATGEHAALSELFRAYQPMLLRYLRSQAEDVADDVASEVWVAVARNLRHFVGDERGFRRWMFTIARCRLIEAHRRQERRRTTSITSEALEHLPQPSSPSERVDPERLVVDGVSAQEAIDAVVAALSPDQAEALLLRIVAGLHPAEVAAVMGRSPGSVRVLCHRGLRRLRARFPEGQLVK